MVVKKKATKRKVAAKKPAAKRKVAKKPVAKRKVVKKVAKKKSVAKKPAAKRTVAKKVVKKAVVKKPAAVKSVSKAYTKSQIMTYLSEQAGITKKEATTVYESLVGLVGVHLKSKKVANFTFPGLAKYVVSRKPATKARKGVNPFNGEPMTFKAKPARNIVKVRPLKALKDMV
jgi:nucleoid DNA-binding protein